MLCGIVGWPAVEIAVKAKPRIEISDDLQIQVGVRCRANTSCLGQTGIDHKVCYELCRIEPKRRVTNSKCCFRGAVSRALRGRHGKSLAAVHHAGLREQSVPIRSENVAQDAAAT